jgi:hypothetical protein
MLAIGGSPGFLMNNSRVIRKRILTTYYDGTGQGCISPVLVPQYPYILQSHTPPVRPVLMMTRALGLGCGLAFTLLPLLLWMVTSSAVGPGFDSSLTLVAYPVDFLSGLFTVSFALLESCVSSPLLAPMSYDLHGENDS